MFILNKYNEYELEINDIRFVCETVEVGLEETASEVAKIYEGKLDDIVNFMLENGLLDVFGKLTSAEVIESLGKPTIDMNRCLISYLEQTFDDTHIIDVEYGGLLDELFYFNIDG